MPLFKPMKICSCSCTGRACLYENTENLSGGGCPAYSGIVAVEGRCDRRRRSYRHPVVRQRYYSVDVSVYDVVRVYCPVGTVAFGISIIGAGFHAIIAVAGLRNGGIFVEPDCRLPGRRVIVRPDVCRRSVAAGTGQTALRV